MKKVFMVTLLYAMSLCLFAQDYDKDFKYNLFSNVEVGAAGIYSYSLDSKHHNAGAEFRLTKQIGEYWKVRGIANVNGFISNGFDRYGKGLIGLSLGKVFYGFVDYGAVCNPSANQTFGMAMDGGLGLNFNLGEVTRLYLEGGIDRVNNGNLWQSNLFAKGGLSFNLGITDDDEIELSVKKNQPVIINELKKENAELRDKVAESERNKDSIIYAINKLNAKYEKLEQELEKCKQNLIIDEEEEMVVYFDYASSEVTIDLTKYADIIKQGGYYRIDGYASNNGVNYWSISENRAIAVMEELVRLGVDRSNIIAVGNGRTEQFGNELDDNQCVYIRKIK